MPRLMTLCVPAPSRIIYYGSPLLALAMSLWATLSQAVGITQGTPTAPVKIVEYSSITCGHCATHSQKVMPLLLKKYIEPGKVHYTISDFPIDAPSLKLAQVVGSLPKQRQHKIRQALLHNHQKWLLTKDPVASAQKFLYLAGISAEDFNKAIANEPLKQRILKQRLATKNVTATPTFIITTSNGYYKAVEGLMGVKKFQSFVDKALAYAHKKAPQKRAKKVAAG